MGTTSKALTLLNYFTTLRPAIGLSDLARLSGTNKATCFRLMSELVEHGLAEQITATKEYRIGPAVLRLAALRETSVPTRAAAQPLLQALAIATGETAHMSHLVAGRLETLSFAYASSHGIRVMMDDADHLPFHATSSGYAILAWLSQQEVERLLQPPLLARTPLTPTERDAVLARVLSARRMGWAETESTFEAGVNSFAVPLFNAQGQVQGAMAVAAATARLTAENRREIPRQLIATARAAMALWGGVIPKEINALWRDVDALHEVQK